MQFRTFVDDVGSRAARAAAGDGALAAWAGNLMLLRSVPSTNALGRRILDELQKENLPLPRAVIASFGQSEGRGRQGATWLSPPGRGVYVSLLFPLADPGDLPTLPLLAPVGVAHALNRWLGGRCRIKWPNDLLVGERKIAGVLLAGVSGGGNGNSAGGAVVGLGVNHAQSADELAGIEPRGTRGATSLALEMRHGAALPPLAEVAWAVVESVVAELQHAGDGRRAVASYEALSIHRLGERLRCRQPGGTLEGLFRGFDQRGFLRLELTSGGAGRRAGDEVLVTAGEVAAP